MEEQLSTKETKVYNLVVELEEVKAQKRASTRSFNEEIKRLEDEIKDLLEEQ